MFINEKLKIIATRGQVPLDEKMHNWHENIHSLI